MEKGERRRMQADQPIVDYWRGQAFGPGAHVLPDPAGLLAEMERLWHDCVRSDQRPAYVMIPSSWLEKKRIGRHVIRRRGRRYVVNFRAAILPAILAQFGIPR